MPPEDLISPDFLQVFALIFIRLGILVGGLPAAISQVFPIRFRIVLTAFVSFLIALPKQDVLSNGMDVDFPVAVFQEALLGLSLAITLSCFFYAFQMAGQLISQMTGGSLVHPTAVVGSTTGSPLATFFMLLAVVLFLSTGCHRSIVDVVLSSLTEFPPGIGWKIENSLGFLIEILDFSFRVAVRISAPIVVCLIGTTLVMSLLAKLVSYFGFFTVGLSINALVLMVTLFFSIAAVVVLTKSLSQDAVEMTTKAFQILRP